VPAVLRNLLRYLEQTGRRLDFMKLLVAGSDTWYASEYRRVQELCGPQTRVINSYGLTEATIDSTWFEQARLELPADRVLPIGRPFGNTTVYILDAHLQPVPAGAVGELCIGGPGVARGYLNRPELTAQKFIADPHQKSPAARLYRTGDLGRWLPDGNIELLGRSDQQVKIRGIRVELGEIEALLSEYPGVRQVAALVREDAPDDRRLVVYLVADAPPPTPAALREYVAGKLPQALHPAAYVLLDTLPLTPNGKINRKALPAPGESAVVARTFTPPQNDTERVIAEIWRAVLKVERVGRDDNFFDLGGHSLLVVELHTRLSERFGARLPIIELFEHATVKALAERLTPPAAPGANDAAAPVAEDPQLAALRARAARQKQALGRGPTTTST
jgi:acyl carrier protein